jgi:hypothetical protein
MPARRTLRVEELDPRYVPATIGPIINGCLVPVLGPDWARAVPAPPREAAFIATPDHTHALPTAAGKATFHDFTVTAAPASGQVPAVAGWDLGAARRAQCTNN